MRDANFKTSFQEIPKRIDVRKRTSPEGVLPYDIDNLYPQRVELYIQGSATAKAVSDLFVRHVYGEGFVGTMADEIVNEDQDTMNDVLEKACNDLKIGGFALHFNYNALLQISSIQFVPFKFVRQWDDKVKEHQNQYAIYDDWDRVKSTRINKKDVSWVDKFTADPEKIADQIAKSQNANGETTGAFEDWNGHLFYFPENYPLSPMDSAISDMETDAELSLFRNGIARRSFLGSYLISMKQELEGKDEQKNFEDNIRTLQGGRQGGGIVLATGIGEGNEITFQKLESTDHDGLFDLTEQSSQKNIRKTLLAPRELVGEDFASGFSTDQVLQMRRYYNSVTDHVRETVCKQFRKFVPLFERNINPSGEFMIQPLYETELSHG